MSGTTIQQYIASVTQGVVNTHVNTTALLQSLTSNVQKTYSKWTEITFATNYIHPIINQLTYCTTNLF